MSTRQGAPANTIPHADTPLLTITVRGKPCSANSMYRHTARGVHLTTAAKEWKACVRDEAWIEMRDTRAQLRMTLGACYHVVCIFYGVKGDVDNMVKTTIDGLKEGIGVDDRYYSSIEAHKGEDGAIKQGARIAVYQVAQAPS